MEAVLDGLVVIGTDSCNELRGMCPFKESLAPARSRSRSRAELTGDELNLDRFVMSSPRRAGEGLYRDLARGSEGNSEGEGVNLVRAAIDVSTEE